MDIEFCARGEKTNQRKETDEKTPDLTLRFRRFSLKKIYFPSVAKYSFTIFTTVPDNRNTAIRFGIAISPLKVSAILHRSPKFHCSTKNRYQRIHNHKRLDNLLAGKQKLDTSCSVQSPSDDGGKGETAHRHGGKNRYPAAVCGGKS